MTVDICLLNVVAGTYVLGAGRALGAGDDLGEGVAGEVGRPRGGVSTLECALVLDMATNNSLSSGM